MNNGVTKENKSTVPAAAFWVGLAILAILLLCSIVVLSVRLYTYVKTDDRTVELKSNMDTQLDIFSVTYENDMGEITVEGLDGQKVVAPGTDVDYTVRLRNTDKVAIDYDLSPAASFLSEYEIPILVRLLDPNDEYILGDAKTWVPVDELNSITASGTLAKGEAVEYLFQWKWPFEMGDDSYDTQLGDVAAETDIGVEVSFTALATANTALADNGGFFGSGTHNNMLLLILLILLLIAIVLLMLYKIFAHTAIVSVTKLAELFGNGETVTLDALKEKALVADDTLKVWLKAKKEDTLDKAIHVEADFASRHAKNAVNNAGGSVFNKKRN